ncbi:MAG: ATP-binding protein [Planctomycetota bacterium]
MKELVVVSGKGGTGKTSIAASMAALAAPLVIVDCDVDAADLHLIVEPRIRTREDFVGGNKARIDATRCTACGRCRSLCRFDAIQCEGPGNASAEWTCSVDRLACEGCGVCADHCAQGAIDFAPAVAGEWYLSATRLGPMLHARLLVGAENSGKLVTHLRQAAHTLAHEQGLQLIVSDGSPGIGCPVIASLTAASLALVVVEPTLSGLHDFNRIARLVRQLRVPAVVLVNKFDLNPQIANELESTGRTHCIDSVGLVPYDPTVTAAQLAGRSTVEYCQSPAAEAIRAAWTKVQDRLQDCASLSPPGLVSLDTH